MKQEVSMANSSNNKHASFSSKETYAKAISCSVHRVMASTESRKAFLVSTGIYTKTGELAKNYR